MYLSRLELEDYRGYESAALDLPESGVVVIAGANNAGKSALLAALDLFSTWDALGQPGSNYVLPTRDRATGPTRVTGVFRWSPSDHALTVAQQISGQAPERAAKLNEITQRLIGDRGHVSEVQVVATGGVESGESEPEQMLVHHIGVGPGVHRIDALDVATWLASGQTRMSTATGNSPTLLELPIGQWGDDANAVFRRWRQTYFHLRVDRTSFPRSVRIEGAPQLQADGSNLARGLLELNTGDPDKFREVADVAADIVPELADADLRTPVAGEVVSVVFVRPDDASGAGRNLADMGSGVGQLLLLAYIGETYPPGSLLVVEEPETHLHPGAQRRLFNHLQRWARHKPIVLATHSPVFLDRTGGGVPIWLVERSSATTASTVRPGDPDLSDVLKQLGVRPSDVLGCERALVVEGPSDRDMLYEWFADELRSARIAVIATQGGDEAWRFKSLSEVVEALPLVVPPTLRFLLDRDERNRTQIAKITEKGSVLVLNRREIENYLLDPRAVLAGLVGPGVSTSIEEIEALVRAGADLLLELVIAKTVHANLPHTRLIDRSLMKELGEGPVTKQRFISLVGERVTESAKLSDEISSRWSEAEERIRSTWQSEWRSLAPGSDVLAYVFKNLGRNYDKGRSGVELARNTPPPDDLRRLIFERGFGVPSPPDLRVGGS